MKGVRALCGRGEGTYCMEGVRALYVGGEGDRVGTIITGGGWGCACHVMCLALPSRVPLPLVV